MKLVLNWLISAVVIMIAAYLLPGVAVSGWVAALVLALVLGAINAYIKPLFVALTFPITAVTFGLFLLVINALLIMLADKIVPGFSVASFWWALLFSVVISIISSVLQNASAKSA